MKITQITLLITLTIACLGFSARADVVFDWNNSALVAIRSAKTSPPMASRNFAILHVAIDDAVNGITGKHEQRRLPYLATEPGLTPASQKAAASAAAHSVLTALWPEQAGRFDAERDSILSAITDRRARDAGIAYGKFVAKTVLAARANDGSDLIVPYTAPPAPGIWRPHVSFGGIVRPALLPGWGQVTPFGVESVAAFRPPPPPALASRQYAEEVEMIKAVGGMDSPLRTPEQTEIALFWANGGGTATPPGCWNLIAQDIAMRSGNSLEENARLFALLNIALADAAIVAWDCKYTDNLWRPITAIQEADTDGNDATEKDPNWAPLLYTPPFPEYVSGHSVFSAAAATVLAGFFGTDKISFTLRSEEYPNLVRSYNSLSYAAVESGYSRIYGGIHFLSGNLQGLRAGMFVGRNVIENICLPEGEHGKRPGCPQDWDMSRFIRQFWGSAVGK